MLGPFSPSWTQGIASIDSAEFWSPLTRPSCSGSPETMLTSALCCGTSGWSQVRPLLLVQTPKGVSRWGPSELRPLGRGHINMPGLRTGGRVKLVSA